MKSQLQSELVLVIQELRGVMAAYRAHIPFDEMHPRIPAAEIAICISELFLKDEVHLPLSKIEVWFQHGRNVEDAFQRTPFERGINLYYRMLELCRELYF